jgi:hypothetical protein
MSKAETLQIKIDGDLAKAIQKNTEAQKLGVSQFILRAVRFYLSRSDGKKDMEIRRKYHRGYGNADLTALSLEMKEWEEEQVWPEP